MRIRIKFSKEGCMKFIGHLDMMRYFQKALRRAEIDVAFSEGFSPHMIMSFAAPLGVGITSTGEYFDVDVRTPISSKEAEERLNAVMADGVKILSVRKVSEDKKDKAMTMVGGADYTVTIREDSVTPDFKEKFTAFMNQPQISIMKKTKKSEKEMEIRPLIHQWHFLDEENQEGIFLRVSCGSVNNLKPELVFDAFAQYCGQEKNTLPIQIHRIETYSSDFIALEDLGECVE